MSTDSFHPTNPYAAPLTDSRTDQRPDTPEEAIRREHLSHEASIRAMGLLFLLGAVLLTLYVVAGGFMGVLALIAIAQGQANADLVGIGILVGIFVLVILITILQWWVGLGLRRLDHRVRTPAIALSALGLLGFPVGTLINGYFLYLLLSKKGKYILTPQYQAIRAATPHIRYRTSIVVWIFLILLIVVLAVGFTAAILG